jgi:hypothetical protein
VQLAGGLQDPALLHHRLEDLQLGEIHAQACSFPENTTFLIIQYRRAARDLSIPG